MADFIKSLWSDKIIQALYEDPDLNGMFDRSLESYAKGQGGNKIILPTLGPGGTIVRTDNKTIGAGLPLSTNDISKGALELDIYEYTYGPILVRKLDEVQSNAPLLQKCVNEVSQAFKEFIFTTAATHIINNVHADNKLKWTGTNGTKLTYYDVKAMRTALNKKKVLTNNRYSIMDPDAESMIGDDDFLKHWYAIQQQAITSGQLAALAGFGLDPTVLVPLTTAAGAIDADANNNKKLNVLGWRKDHLNLIIQTEMEITGGEQATLLGYQVAFTNRFGVLLDRSIGAVQSTQQ